MEHRIKLVHSHLGDQGHNITLDIIASHHVAQSHLNHVGNTALRLGHTEVHRHSLDAHGLSSLMLQHHVAHLRTVTVTNHHIIVSFQ